MICGKCGADCRDGSKFCPKCGAVLGQNVAEKADKTSEKTEETSEEIRETSVVTDKIPNGGAKTRESGLSRKMLLIAVLIAVVLIVVVVFCVLFGGRSSRNEENFQNHVESGQKYLEDENYEEAVNEFTAALDIEENVETYQMLAESYLGMGDEEKAEATYDVVLGYISDSYSQTGELPENSTDAYVDVINHYGGQGDTDKVQELADSALALLDDETEISLISDLETDYVMNWIYYEKLAEDMEAYGGPEVVSEGDTNYLSGLSFAKLVDLDGDGQEELLVSYQDTEEDQLTYQAEVWDYTEDGIMLIYDDTLLDQGDGISLGLVVEDDATSLVQISSGEESFTLTVSQYLDGQMVAERTLFRYWDEENHTWQYEINGESVSYTEWYEAYNEWNESSVSYSLSGEKSSLAGALSELASTFAGMETRFSETEEFQTITDLDDSYGVAWVYYHKILAYQAIYGTGEIKNDICIDGLALAKLLDFNGDGQSELILAYQDAVIDENDDYPDVHYTVEVWTYDDEKGMQLIYSGSASEGDGFSGLFISDQNDTYYIERYKEGGDVIFYSSFWEYVGEQFEKVISLYGENIYRGEDYYFEVNGEEVDEEEWSRQYNQWLYSDGKTYDFYTNETEYLEETLQQTDTTVEELVAELGLVDVTVGDETEVEAETQQDWKQIYMNYITVVLPEEESVYISTYDCTYTYSLIYLNEDDIPELLVQRVVSDNDMIDSINNNYCLISVDYYSSDNVNRNSMMRSTLGEILFTEREGIIYDHTGFGSERTYYMWEDWVYEMQDGELNDVFHGWAWYTGAEYEYLNDWLFESSYSTHDDGEITHDEYMAELAVAFDTSTAITPVFVSYEEILAQIENY